jgi:ferric-dicitrate binding protein FerR (iron transport regulator)
MQPADQWHYLLQQYLQDKATEAERMHLFQALQENEADWESFLVQIGLQQPPDPNYNQSDWTAMIARIVQQPTRKPRVYAVTRWWMAAAILVMVVGGIWFLADRSKHKQPSIVAVPVVPDVMPGKEGAILTLADGRQVIIDSAGNGAIAQEGNTVVRRDGAQLIYEKNNTGAPAETAPATGFNILGTPRGRQFQLVLPDGSKVWLNAASSIRYPVVFTGNERRVEITGEAYFEITSLPLTASGGGKKKPFIVSIAPAPGERIGREVKVLGTHFNINAYDDEPVMKTTLLEGAVVVTAGAATARLKPGQQAWLTDQQSIQIRSADLDAVVAWKNGLFDFQDVPLQQVMRQLARWYDIAIQYENGIPKIEFGGKMGRDLTLSKVLYFLERSGLHCRLDNNRRLIVMPD